MVTREEMVEAGAKALQEAQAPVTGWGWAKHASVVLDAIEPLLREQIAQEIEAFDYGRTSYVAFLAQMMAATSMQESCAAIARGAVR